MQLTTEQAEVVSMCADGVQKAREDYRAPRVLFFGTVAVKFRQSDILNEGDTQAFVYEAFNSIPNGPRVPKVYNCFAWNRMQYLVMERVELPTVEAWISDACDEAETQSRFDMACQAVGQALNMLFKLSPPPGAEIGMIKGPYAQTQSERDRSTSGCSHHPFFGVDCEAPYRYPCALSLEKHITKALSHRPRCAPPRAVNIANEPLVMAQGNIKKENFLIDPQTLRVTILGFRWISAVPYSLASFTLDVDGGDFIAGIAKSLNWKPSENFPALVAAAVIYFQTSSCHFCLDKYGNPFPKRKPHRTAVGKQIRPSQTRQTVAL